MKKLAGLLIILFANSANAGLIDFEDVIDNTINEGALESNRYSSLGVTFNSTDDGSTWDGTEGDWGLTGSNGDVFSGFNGETFMMTMLFDSAVMKFSLDSSRAKLSTEGDGLVLKGYLNDSLVDSVALTFGDVNHWSTFSLSGEIDKVQWTGSGSEDPSGDHTYGVDNIQWTDKPSKIPEPNIIALFALGLAGISFSRKIKKT